jgi:CRISPR-associated protein Csx17
MPSLVLENCTSEPLGSYLKALAVLRLVTEQADGQARGHWDAGRFVLSSRLCREELVDFFLARYKPTPIVAPWNGGSGYYEKDNKEAIDLIAGSDNARFEGYRKTIAFCRELQEVKSPKTDDEDKRRTTILRECRNWLSDATVEWLDAAVGLSADGSRAFAPILGTGGNEGRLDYTNNFMGRVSSLLLTEEGGNTANELLRNALFNEATNALRNYAAGQFDPGRAGGANQGQGVSGDAATNPWDFVLTMEGAVVWASGIYRRQGVGYRPLLCSPFTVNATRVGYASAADGDDARAEIWTPLWKRAVGYGELRTLLREGRATVQGRPAKNALEFAEAACSLGIDRGIDEFVRYSLLKRRGDSYVALPVGAFKTGYKSESDRARELIGCLENLRGSDEVKNASELMRPVEAAIYQLLLHGGAGRSVRMRAVVAAFGRLLREFGLRKQLPFSDLSASEWLSDCGPQGCIELRLAAALGSVFDREAGSIRENLSRENRRFAWQGGSLESRLISVLTVRMRGDSHAVNPLGGRYSVHAGDVTRFIEGEIDYALLEDLLFAFASFRWDDFKPPKPEREAEPLPVYCLLKHLFLPSALERDGEEKAVKGDPRVIEHLQAGRVEEAATFTSDRLRALRFRPVEVSYSNGGEVDAQRLCAALMIPVRYGTLRPDTVFHSELAMEEAV